MTHKIHKTFKSGLLLVGLAIVLSAVVGFSYFNNTGKTNKNSLGTTASTCSANNGGSCGGGSCGAGGGSCGINSATSTPAQTTPAQTTPVQTTAVTKTASSTSSDTQTINVDYSDNGINPSTINLQQGKKYQIVMTMNHDPRGCMNTILLRGLDERVQPVQRGTTLTFNVDATTPGNYGFVCGAMGMSHGAQVVIQ